MRTDSTLKVNYSEPFAPGTLGSKTYRIPGIWTLNNGNVFAVADMRYDHGSDSPNNIDILFAKSEDGYKEWSYCKPNYFDDYSDSVTDKGSASYIDSAVAQSLTEFLKETGLENGGENSPEYRYYVSDKPDSFVKQASILIGRQVDGNKVLKVDINNL